MRRADRGAHRGDGRCRRSRCSILTGTSITSADRRELDLTGAPDPDSRGSTRPLYDAALPHRRGLLRIDRAAAGAARPPDHRRRDHPGFGESSVRAIHTPGHTPGSTCYLARRAARRSSFSGDALSLARSDEPTCGAETRVRSSPRSAAGSSPCPEPRRRSAAWAGHHDRRGEEGQSVQLRSEEPPTTPFVILRKAKRPKDLGGKSREGFSRGSVE